MQELPGAGAMAAVLAEEEIVRRGAARVGRAGVDRGGEMRRKM